jgi:hypothetical protein
MLSDLHLSENSFKHKAGKDGVSGKKKRHRTAISSYEIDSKVLMWFTSLNQTNCYFFSYATTCPLWTSWSPLPVVAEV